MLKAYSKKDPPPNRVKPVPIMIIHRIFAIASNTNDPFTQAVADMIGLAFFFLLHPVNTLIAHLTPLPSGF